MSHVTRLLIKVLCIMNSPPNYIVAEAAIIQYNTVKQNFGLPRGGGKKQLKMSINHLELKLPHFLMSENSMFINTTMHSFKI